MQKLKTECVFGFSTAYRKHYTEPNAAATFSVYFQLNSFSFALQT